MRGVYLESACACDVVSVDVSVHHELQTQPQLPHQLGVPLGLLDDRVDQDGLLGVGVGQEVGVGGGLRVKQLSEYHDCVVTALLAPKVGRSASGLTRERDHMLTNQTKHKTCRREI